MEKDIRKTRTCERCKTQVPLANVRLFARDENKNWLLCEVCCDILKNKGQSSFLEAKKKPIRNIYQPKESGNIRPPAIQRKTETSSKERVQCTRCKFGFSVDKEKADVLYRLHCPYCGKEDKLQY